MATPVAATATGTSGTRDITSRVPLIDAPAAEPATVPVSLARSDHVAPSDGGRGVTVTASVAAGTARSLALPGAGASAAAFRGRPGRFVPGLFAAEVRGERDEVIAQTLRVSTSDGRHDRAGWQPAGPRLLRSELDQRSGRSVGSRPRPAPDRSGLRWDILR